MVIRTTFRREYKCRVRVIACRINENVRKAKRHCKKWRNRSIKDLPVSRRYRRSCSSGLGWPNSSLRRCKRPTSTLVPPPPKSPVYKYRRRAENISMSTPGVRSSRHILAPYLQNTRPSSTPETIYLFTSRHRLRAECSSELV